MHDKIGTKIDGPHETRRRDRIVDEEGHGVPVCHTGDSLDIRNIETRVFYHLDICHLDARSCLLESGSEVVWSRALREADLDTEAVKQGEQFDRASIERRRCHDHIPCLDEGHEGCRKRTHARGIGHGRCSALELVHCTLEGGNGRIGNTRIQASCWQRPQPAPLHSQTRVRSPALSQEASPCLHWAVPLLDAGSAS